MSPEPPRNFVPSGAPSAESWKLFEHEDWWNFLFEKIDAAREIEIASFIFKQKLFVGLGIPLGGRVTKNAREKTTSLFKTEPFRLSHPLAENDFNARGTIDGLEFAAAAR